MTSRVVRRIIVLMPDNTVVAAAVGNNNQVMLLVSGGRDYPKKFRSRSHNVEELQHQLRRLRNEVIFI